MDDVRVGAAIRAVRLRRGLSQAEIAAAAGVSDSTVSLIEQGRLDEATVKAIRRVAGAVGMHVPFEPRWRGADLAKLLDEAHARACRQVVARLESSGWIVRPEFTFNWRGERGSVDILAWHPASRCLLIVEVKTALADLQDLLSTMDRKLRIVPLLVPPLGWRPCAVATVLVLPDESWSRKAVADYGPLFEAALPARTVAVRRWLSRPSDNLRGIWFLPTSNSTGVGCRRRSPLRIRRRPKARRDALDEANLAASRPG